jgi:hypothetical protein
MYNIKNTDFIGFFLFVCDYNAAASGPRYLTVGWFNSRPCSSLQVLCEPVACERQAGPAVTEKMHRPLHLLSHDDRDMLLDGCGDGANKKCNGSLASPCPCRHAGIRMDGDGAVSCPVPVTCGVKSTTSCPLRAPTPPHRSWTRNPTKISAFSIC